MRVHEVIAHCRNHLHFPSPLFLSPALSSVLPASVFLLLPLDISPLLQRFIEMAMTCKLIAHCFFRTWINMQTLGAVALTVAF